MSATLTVQYNRSTSDESLYGFSLQVVVTAASGMPPEVFIFQRGAAPAPFPNASVVDYFVCIADPVDLQEIPAIAPDLNQEMPYYRLNSVTLVFRDTDELEFTQNQIKGDLQNLVKSVNAMAVLTPQEVDNYA